MTRVEFRLSMPGRSSWNGGWSGEGRNYSLVRELSTDAVERLFAAAPAGAASVSWSHRWSDGWCATITARIVPTDAALPKSDGFHGYEWMVDNILSKGHPYGEVTS